MMAFLNGAGSIRAYPHAENTGLVISDVAKVGTFFNNASFLNQGTGPCLTRTVEQNGKIVKYRVQESR